MNFKKEIETLLNQACRENESNTPDFILAEYLMGCLSIAESLIIKRDLWYSVHLEPANKYFIKEKQND